MDESLINHAAKCEKVSGGNFAVVIRTKVCLCEKEPISDYPVSQFITGECTKISYTLANLLRPTIRLITLIILTEQNTGQSMDN